VVPDLLGDQTVTATDGCNELVTITQSPAAGSLFTNEVTIVLLADDPCGNIAECSVVLTCEPPAPDCVGFNALVFQDANLTGDFEIGVDPAFDGVTVRLFDADANVLVDEQTSKEDGLAAFLVQQGGNDFFEIDESTLPGGFISAPGFTNPTPVFFYNPFDDNTCSEVLIAYREVCDICGVVWFDADGQGDPGENLSARGVNEVTVELQPRGGGTPIAADVTSTRVCERLSANTEIAGVYLFTDVPIGDYDIVIDLASVPSDLSGFFDEEPARGVEPRQSTTELQYEYSCGGRGSNAPEDPDFGFIQEPTFVSLVTFTGSPVAGGLVELEWVTAVEFQNLGFNVYRSGSVHGEHTLIKQSNDPLLRRVFRRSLRHDRHERSR